MDRRGRRGVWFFSLDAARALAVVGARIGYALPYFWSRMSVKVENNSIHYASRRLHGPMAQADIRIGIEDDVLRQSELDIFLTARFRLYSMRWQTLFRADIDHPPWLLQKARVIHLAQNLIQAAALRTPGSEPLVHFSRSVHVRVAAPMAV